MKVPDTIYVVSLCGEGHYHTDVPKPKSISLIGKQLKINDSKHKTEIYIKTKDSNVTAGTDAGIEWEAYFLPKIDGKYTEPPVAILMQDTGGGFYLSD